MEYLFFPEDQNITVLCYKSKKTQIENKINDILGINNLLIIVFEPNYSSFRDISKISGIDKYLDKNSIESIENMPDKYLDTYGFHIKTQKNPYVIVIKNNISLSSLFHEVFHCFLKKKSLDLDPLEEFIVEYLAIDNSIGFFDIDIQKHLNDNQINQGYYKNQIQNDIAQGFDYIKLKNADSNRKDELFFGLINYYCHPFAFFRVLHERNKEYHSEYKKFVKLFNSLVDQNLKSIYLRLIDFWMNNPINSNDLFNFLCDFKMEFY
ncbi:hypothetical protein [Candidatus Lokiarchaeum ossiferum]|uniref:hypothetical protein n=1 Tax=Candidatus Lokiarchaeum ossiferum TaxID=2951803 RepID=UPI00352F78AF